MVQKYGVCQKYVDLVIAGHMNPDRIHGTGNSVKLKYECGHPCFITL